MPCNKIGIKFTTQSYTIATIGPYHIMNNYAHLYAQNVISDTTNWTVVQGSFTADSAYSYINIGNFFTNNNVDTVATGNSAVSYFYVDNVIVSTDSSIIDGLRPLGATSSNQGHLFAYPNPVADKIKLKYSGNYQLDKLTIYNVLGETLITILKPDDELELSIENFPRGFYFIAAERKAGQKVIKILKE